MNSEAKQELDAFHRDSKETEARITKLNFQLGDFLNQYVVVSGLNAHEASQLLESNSEFTKEVLQTNARIARRIPIHSRPKDVSWSVVKYIAIDINPRRLKELGYLIGKSDFCSAASKALIQIENEGLSWSRLRDKDDEGISIGERIVISHVTQA